MGSGNDVLLGPITELLDKVEALAVRVKHLEAEVRDLHRKTQVQESRVSREHVAVRPSDPRAEREDDDTPTRPIKRSSQALKIALEAAEMLRKE